MTKFNIETHLKNLPSNTQSINLRDKQLTYLPDLSRFKYLRYLDCSNNKLTSLPKLNSKLINLDCSNNQITSLPELNTKLLYINCQHNQLTSLPELNTELKYLNCHHNQLTSLPKLNKNLKRLVCSCNLLTTLPKLNNKLEELVCYNNKLTSLPQLNENLLELLCYNNQLTYFPELNDKLINFQHNVNYDGIYLSPYYYEENPASDIIMREDTIIRPNITIYKMQINIHNRFRHLCFCLKYKRQFLKWLWERVREPKIKQKYHPDKLNELLTEESDLNEVLEKW